MPTPSGSKKSTQRGQEFSFPAGAVIDVRVKPPEKSAEAAHRRRKANWSFWVKDVSTYVVALLIILATAIYCFWTLIRTEPPLDEKKFAMSILMSLVVGIMGYLFGKVTK